MTDESISVTVGEGVVTVKRKGTRAVAVANVLGSVLRDGFEVICLDRLVHQFYESSLGDWRGGGAVTTMLYRPAGPLPPGM